MSIVIIPLGQECGVREGPKTFWAPNLRCIFYSSAITVVWGGRAFAALFLIFVLMDCIIFLMLNENEAVHFASALYNRSLVED